MVKLDLSRFTCALVALAALAWCLSGAQASGPSADAARMETFASGDGPRFFALTLPPVGAPADAAARLVPPDALLFCRAIAGLGHNLRTLKSNGDFRQFLRDGILEVRAHQQGA